MINPSQVTVINPARENEAAMVRQERLFDEAIRRAENTGKWPATVPRVRADATLEVIRSTIERYRAAGWVVIEGRGDPSATIDHPDRKAAPDAGTPEVPNGRSWAGFARSAARRHGGKP